MAELAASLIGIVGAGTKVAMVLLQVAAEIGSAGKEPRIMAREIRSFCTIIRVLSQTMDSVHSEMTWDNYSDCSETISDMMAVSKEMFTEILGLIDSIQKSSLGGSTLPNNSGFNLASRIRWVMNKPKFVFLRTALEAYKSNLSLLIGSIQLSQSLASASSASGSGEDMLRQAATNRASLSLSIDLQDIANDYQASIQEMETARLEVENETSYEPPPWESLPGNVGVVESTAMDAQQDPQLREMIATAEEEVRSLRPSSSVYSDSTASIYSSLSRHSRRMSLIVDELPMIEVMTASERRKSSALSIRNSRIAPPPSTLSSVPETRQLSAPQLPIQWPEPQESQALEEQPREQSDGEKAFQELMWKYRMVKRLYFDGKVEIKELNSKLSAVQNPDWTIVETRTAYT
ncbi:hypothetical protein diail_5908 [Diaporthe ilicicola]|nr:hypothetical protein diail_5908 [Diaporthe ilicicola]